jgi:branched-chain amino acid transport system permease protein
VTPRMRPSLRTALAVLLLIALALAPLAARAAGNPYLLSLGTRATILALGAVSLQFAVGFAGLPSLGHAAFLGIGAYALGILGANGLDDAAISLPIALAAAGVFAIFTGAVALRASGVAFLMITLAFAQMAFFVATSLSAYGGDNGMTLDRAPPLLGASPFDSPVALHATAFVLLLAMILLLHAIGLSRFGRVLRAARENATRVTALGYDVRGIRLAAYTLSGMGGALAGWLLAANAGFISPAVLDWRMSGELLVMVILGGATAPLHAALGAVGLVLAEEFLAGFTEHRGLVIGPLLILAVLLTRKRGAFA